MMSPVLVRDIARVVLPRHSQDGRLLMLSAYFDDSGTHANAPVVVWGGLLGTVDQWAVFERGWSALLAAPLPGKPSLNKFGTADCHHRKKEFTGYNQAESDRVTHLFRRTITSAGLVHTASVVCRAEWEAMIVGGLRDRLGSAEIASFVNCVISAVEWAEKHPSGDPHLSLTFDLGRLTTEIAEMKERILSFDRPHLRVKIASFNFGSVADFLPLQGADMIATESYWAAQRWLEKHNNYSARAHFRDLLQNAVGVGWIADKEVIEETVQKFAREGVVA